MAFVARRKNFAPLNARAIASFIRVPQLVLASNRKVSASHISSVFSASLKNIFLHQISQGELHVVIDLSDHWVVPPFEPDLRMGRFLCLAKLIIY
jgi:hypothetical protein